jgi:type 1 glutamine amidotransferase
VLIVTGEDYPGHDWRQTAPVLGAALDADSRIEVQVLDDLTLLGETDLTPFASVVLHFKNYDPAVPGRAGFDRLESFVEGGGGLVLAHFACGAFEEFRDDFAALAGRVWFGAEPPPGRAQHDPHGEFTVRIADPTHPITRGLEPFTTTDELYTCLTGDAAIHVLADAVSVRDGETYPMAFVLPYGKGRVFHCVLGHDPASLTVPAVAEFFRRATAWVSGLTPSDPSANLSTDE